VIVEAGVAHAGVMAAVHGAAFPDEPWDEAAFAVLLGQPGVVGFLDDRGGVLLLRVVADEAEILTVGVARKRAGIGRGLMEAALAQARAAGAKKLFLEVAASNEAAVGLYGALGFTAVGRRLNYYSDGGEAVVLSIGLEAGAGG
jgi:ribosomal-protein-alanine N-acetyltransferase